MANGSVLAGHDGSFPFPLADSLPLPSWEKQSLKTQPDWWFPNTGTQREKQHPLRLGAWEVFFKLASITWQMITSFWVIFFLFFFFFSHVCLAWQELSCELMKHQGCTASQIGVVCFQERAWAGRPSAATNQLSPSDSSRKGHYYSCRIWPIPHWNRKTAFILPRAGLVKI